MGVEEAEAKHGVALPSSPMVESLQNDMSREISLWFELLFDHSAVVFKCPNDGKLVALEIMHESHNISEFVTCGQFFMQTIPENFTCRLKLTKYDLLWEARETAEDLGRAQEVFYFRVSSDEDEKALQGQPQENVQLIASNIDDGHPIEYEDDCFADQFLSQDKILRALEYLYFRGYTTDDEAYETTA